MPEFEFVPLVWAARVKERNTLQVVYEEGHQIHAFSSVVLSIHVVLNRLSIGKKRRGVAWVA